MIRIRFASSVVVAALALAGCSGSDQAPAEGNAEATAAPAPATAAPVEAASTPTPTTAAPASETAAAPAACGERGQPHCPLQAFMKAKVGPALQRNDLAALAAFLDLVPASNPDPAWDTEQPGWTKLSQDGAAAARAGNAAGAKASCKGCHEAFQKRYRASFRAHPVPTGMQ